MAGLKFFRPKLDRELFSLAWPVMLSNFLSTVTMFIDLLMVGQIGPEAVAAVGLGTQVLFLVWSVIMGLSAGTIAIVARRYGEKDQERADNVLKQSLTLGVIISIPVALMGVFFGNEIIGLFGAEPVVGRLAYDYISIGFLASTPIFLTFLASSALRGVGDTRTPLYITALLNVINFALNYCLIFGNFGFPEMGVQGAAVGTSIAFTVAFIIYYLFLRSKRADIHLRKEGDFISKDMVSNILRIGLPTGLEQGLLQMGFIVYIAFVVSFGTEALAAHNIGMRIQSMAFMPGLGLSVATTALVGQSLGAERPKKAENFGWEGSKLSVITMASCGLLLFLLAHPISSLFVEEVKVIGLSVDWITILALGTPALGLHFATSGALRGAGDTKWPLYVSFIGLYITRLPLAYFLGFMTPLGIHGIWMSMTIEYYVRALIITQRFRIGGWKSIEV